MQKGMESDVKDLRLHEYMIALFADVRSERHSPQRYNTYREKRVKTNEGPREGRAV